MVHLSVKQYQQVANVDWDRYSVLVEEGTRKRWTKLAEPQVVPKAKAPGTKADTAATPTTLDPLRVPSLPNEVIEKILDMAAGYYEHQAVVITSPFIPARASSAQASTAQSSTAQPFKSRTLFGIYKRRDWNELPQFHLSRGFRETAIMKYGEPDRDSFPYNPDMDTITANIDQEATFFTGYPAVSSFIPERVDQITLKPLGNRPVLIIDGALLRSFGDGTLETEGLIRHLRLRFLQARKAYPTDLTVVSRPLVSLLDLEAFLKYCKKWNKSYHKNLPLSKELLKLF